MGVVQLVLHRIYYKSSSKIGDYKKLTTAEVQLRGIGISDVHKKLAADEVQVQLQKIDMCDDKKVDTAELQLQLQGIVTS